MRDEQEDWRGGRGREWASRDWSRSSWGPSDWSRGDWRRPEWDRGDRVRGDWRDDWRGAGGYGSGGHINTSSSGSGYGAGGFAAGYGGYGAWGHDRGQYAGRGPRSYQRTDERIREDLCERLTEHGFIDASDLDVRVQNGEVTLSGSVNDRWAKRAAEDIADSVWGVKDVHNEIRIAQGERLDGRDEPQRPNARGTWAA
jgi:hypothetical protein